MGKLITILGSTGSIGVQTIDVVRAHADRFEVLALAAAHSVERLCKQAWEVRPKYAFSVSPVPAGLSFPPETRLICGPDAAVQAASLPEADVVVNGISGFAALDPLLSSLEAGKRVALANKESIVCGKPVVDEVLSRCGGRIIPVDSEQSAIYQCLQAGRLTDVSRILLTASGGPFRTYTREQMRNVTPDQALAHPTWRMGRKITLDSATLFNKGLEIIEAAYLFDLPGEAIEVVIHPQSIVHSAVRFKDGAVVLHAGQPDMRVPIQYALTFPERWHSPAAQLDPVMLNGLTFETPDFARFGALRLAYNALTAGGSAPIVYNAANETAAEAFLSGRIGFLDIESAVDHALSSHTWTPVRTREEIREADRQARLLASACIRAHSF